MRVETGVLSPIERAALSGNIDQYFFECARSIRTRDHELRASELLSFGAESGSPIILAGILNVLRDALSARGAEVDKGIFEAVNKKDSFKQTPLHRAVSLESPNKHIVQMLISIGVRDSFDLSELSALDYARRNRTGADCVKIIEDFNQRLETPANYLNNVAEMWAYFTQISGDVLKDPELTPIKQAAANDLIYFAASSLLTFLEQYRDKISEEVKSQILRNSLDLGESVFKDIRRLDLERASNYKEMLSNLANLNDGLIAFGANPATPSDRGMRVWDFKNICNSDLLFRRKLEPEKKEKRVKTKVEVVIPPISPEQARQEQERRWINYLNNLSSRTKNDFLTEFERSGRNLGVRNKEGFSVLRCVIKNCDPEALNEVLNCENLDFEVIAEELRESIRTKNKNAVQTIFANELTISRVASLPISESSDFIESLRTLNKNEEIRKKINVFENAVTPKKPAAKIAEAEEEKGQIPSKAERKELKKKLAAEKKREEEWEKRDRQVTTEVLNDFLAKISLELLVEEALSEDFSEELLQEVIAEVAEESLVRFKEESRQVKDFLSGSRELNSVQELPEFLRPVIFGLLEQDCQVALKGSAVYQASRVRVPSDLDLEVKVRGIHERSNEEVAEFVLRNFDFKIDPTQIYRGPNNDRSTFSLNVKDEVRGLDISIYDPEKMPPQRLSWVTNRDSVKAAIEANGSISRIVQEGLPNPVNLVVNRDARGAILRLCFLEVIGVVNQEDLVRFAQTSSKHPVSLIFQELKLGKVEESERESVIYEKISNHCDKHDLDGDLRQRFLQNLNKVLTVRDLETPSFAVVKQMVQRAFPSASREGLKESLTGRF